MIATVDFIECAGSRSSGEYPLFGASVPSSLIQHTFSNVKFTEDLVQTIVLPEFNGWTECNMVHAYNSDGFDRFYWITGASRSSTVNGAIMYVLAFNAPSSMLKNGDTAKGMWTASPKQAFKQLRVKPASGTDISQRTVPLGGEMGSWETSDGVRHTLGWCQFVTTSTCNLWVGKQGVAVTRGGLTLTASGNGTHIMDDNVDGFNIYGFPVLLDQWSKPNTALHVRIRYIADDGTIVSKDAPTMADVMCMIQNVGFLAGDIQDISVSTACPYNCQIIMGAATASFMLKVDENDTKGITYYSHVNDADTTLGFYLIQGDTAGRTENDVNFTAFLEAQIPDEAEYINNVVLIDNRLEQTVQVRDYSGNLVSTVPIDQCIVGTPDWNAIGVTAPTVSYTWNAYFPISTHVHTDVNGMYRHIIIGEGDTATIITMVEPHLPSISSPWENYKAMSMNDDRNAIIANMAFSAVGTVASVATLGAAAPVMGAMSAGMGLASAGSGLAVSAGSVGAGVGMANAISSGAGGIAGVGQQIYAQHVKERQTQREPNQAINLGYGMNQVITAMEFPPAFVISYPENAVAQLDSYIARYGFPDNGENTYTIGYGYYAGMLYSNKSFTGMLFDELNNCMIQGVLYVNPETERT